MAKATAEQSNRLSIIWLKKHHYLSPKQHIGSTKWGGIRWGDEGDNIGFIVTTNLQDTGGEEDNIRLRYTHTDSRSDKKEALDYRIRLTTTPCRYGGVRYWFICPLFKNGQRCGKRVGVLYQIGKYFGCRYCGNIAYASQRKGGTFRGSSVTIPDIDKAEKEIKRYYYGGKPTRKYRRAMRLENKLERDFIGFAVKAGWRP